MPETSPLVIDTSGLHCPMPLLKLKMALRSVAVDEHIRLIATDPMSQQDIKRYCEIAGLPCVQQPETSDGTFLFDIVKT
jgi:TusA-related sulfurtransferase